MRIYIIGNDGIALCRETPATISDGDIVVTSKEELLAALLNGKRLLALWNALPGVDKRRKVGNREALINQLWSAIESLPDPEPRGDPKRPSKQDVVIAMLRQPEGATVDEVASVTGWQRHTVRGVFSGALKKKTTEALVGDQRLVALGELALEIGKHAVAPLGAQRTKALFKDAFVIHANNSSKGKPCGELRLTALAVPRTPGP